MKKLLLFSFLFVVFAHTSPIQAQAPEKISYQGKLTDSSGNPVSNGSYNIKFSLYDAVNSGSASWDETQGVAVNDGLFSVYLGDINALNITFDKAYWLGVKVGSDAEMTPRTPLSATPYSLHAASIANNSVTNSKIVDNTIALNKIQKGSNGEVLKTEGGNVVWSTPAAVPQGPKMLRHITSAANNQQHVSVIDHPDLNGQREALVVASHNWTQDYVQAIGVWYNGSKWTVYNEDLTDMPENMEFHVVYQLP